MLLRTTLLLFAALLLAAGSNAAARADDEKAHEGMVIKAGDGKLTMSMKGSDKKHTHDVAKDAKITLDEKEANLDDLKEHYHVKVWMNDRHVLTKIEARSKHHDRH